MAEEQKFPTEVIDLPSEGKLYPKDSPLSDGKIEIKYMTAKEEDILTSANLIKKGLAVDTLLNSLIVDKDIIYRQLKNFEKLENVSTNSIKNEEKDFTCSSNIKKRWSRNSATYLT